MTLLIACLLIYHLGLPWWWYVFAGVLWLGRLAVYKTVLADLDTRRTV